MWLSLTWYVRAQPTPQYGQTLSTACVCDGGTSGSVSGLLTRAPVGHEAAHSPQETQVLAPIGWFRSKAMAVAWPLPLRPMTSLDWTSSQARMQRSQRIQAWWSTAMTGEERSFGRRAVCGLAPAGASRAPSRKRLTNP